MSASVSHEGFASQHATRETAAREAGELESGRPVKETAPRSWRWTKRTAVIMMAVVATSMILTVWGRRNSTGLTSLWFPKGEAPGALNIAILVFREGLECILVLAALTASFKGKEAKYHRPVIGGVLVGILATLITWAVAVRILDDLTASVSALAVQAATGLVAIIVLLVVMNWFFHKVYWTGWISIHNQRKQRLLSENKNPRSGLRVGIGMALLGFSSFYREGFEVALFLQSYRLRVGGTPVLQGLTVGVVATTMVAILTFVAHYHLPYRKMLIATGVLLTFVLIVMVGEQAQEMQMAGWLPTTSIPRLAQAIPSWAGLWLSVFPTVETLTAQALGGLLVVGSYIAAQASSSIK